jgi:hypothetical protein
MGTASVAIGGRHAPAPSPLEALRRIAEGSASWVGMDAASGGCIVDISDALVEPDATPETRDAARALYKAQKALLYDAPLVLKALLSHATKRGRP